MPAIVTIVDHGGHFDIMGANAESGIAVRVTDGNSTVATTAASGAGTFDGVFLTGILAVLLAGIAAPSRPRPAW